MNFEETRDLVIRSGQQVLSMYGKDTSKMFVELLDDLSNAISIDAFKKNREKKFYTQLGELTRNIKGLILYTPLDQKDHEVVEACIDVILNWCLIESSVEIPDQERGTVHSNADQAKIILQGKQSLLDLISVARELHRDLKILKANPPMTAQVNSMYNNFLEDYLKEFNGENPKYGL